jgi:hypothetical protein
MRLLPAALALALAVPAVAAPTRLAVMDLHCGQQDQSPELARTLTEVVAFEVGESGRYRVVTTGDIAAALKLKGMQQGVGCGSEACEAELGQSADVEQFVSGMVGRAGSRFLIVLKLLDAKSVTVTRQVRRVVPANEDAMFDAVTDAARELVSPPPAPSVPAAGGRIGSAAGDSAGVGGLGLRGSGAGGGGSGFETIGLGSIGTIGHGAGGGSGTGFGSGAARPAAEKPVSRDVEQRLARRIGEKLASRKSRK